MKLGIAILYKAPDKVPPTLFAFLDPFSGSLWISIALAYVMVSIMMFVVSRFTPMEWVMDDACDIYVSSDKTKTIIFTSCSYSEWADGGVPEPLHQPLAVVVLGRRHVDGLRGCPQSALHAVHCWHVVPVHPHHGLLLHRQPGRLPHCREPPQSNQLRDGKALTVRYKIPR